MASFTELEQKFLKSVWKHRRPIIAKMILREKKKVEESGSLTVENATAIKRVQMALA